MTPEQRTRVEKMVKDAISRTDDHVNGPAAQADADALTALLAERDRLADALRALAFEVSALRIAEYEIRQAIGNTNWSALMSKRSEAAALLPAVSATRRE